MQGAGLTVPLSTEGKIQAVELAERLSREKFDAIFTSQAARAIDTAKPIRAFFSGVPYSEQPELNERSKGEAEGLTKDEFKKKYFFIEEAWAREEDPRIPGGESLADVEKRVWPFLMKLAQERVGQRLLLVFHGNVIRVILGAILGAPVQLLYRLKQDYCAINVVEYDQRKKTWFVVKVNG